MSTRVLLVAFAVVLLPLGMLAWAGASWMPPVSDAGASGSLRGVAAFGVVDGWNDQGGGAGEGAAVPASWFRPSGRAPTPTATPTSTGPTDTATPTPTGGHGTPTPPRPTNTPTPAPGDCPERLTDGGFEAATDFFSHPNWQVEGNARFTIDEGMSRTGAAAVIFGWTFPPPADGALWQRLTVPQHASAAEISFTYMVMGVPEFNLQIQVTNSTGSQVFVSRTLSTGSFDWQRYTYRFTAADLTAISGQTVRLRLQISGLTEALDLVLDDLSWKICAGSAATPTPTPQGTQGCSPEGVTLEMPAHFYGPGDPCSLTAYICNPGQFMINSAPIFVILDVLGSYYFAPSFSEWGDHYVKTLAPGVSTLVVLPTFNWPSGAGSFSGARFWGAQTNAAMNELVGNLASWEFGWSS
jgi:hypothetical protein